MSDIAELIGARVDSLTIGVAHFRLNLSGGDQQFSISTSADVDSNDGAQTDFRGSTGTDTIVRLLGAALTNIKVDSDCRSGAISFDNGTKLRVWWPDKIYDNLLIVRNHKDHWWFAVG